MPAAFAKTSRLGISSASAISRHAFATMAACRSARPDSFGRQRLHGRKPARSAAYASPGRSRPPSLSCPMIFTRIATDPALCTGKPCIRGLRFPVARLLGLLAAGEPREQILQNYPYLEHEDIDEALRYAAFL